MVAAVPELLAAAAQLAARLRLPLEPPPSGEPAGAEFHLVLTPQRLELRETAARGRPVFVDFVAAAAARGRHARGEAVVRAVGPSHGSDAPAVLDATAGLGRDALLLAASGCRVLACERSPVIAALLEDGMRRARAHAATGAWLEQRLRLHPGPAEDVLEQERFDVIYLDPMHPQRHRSALAKKEMRWFRRLVGGDPDATGLFDRARAAARRRVVVKRPVHGAPLAPGVSFALRGRSTRFDVYLAQAQDTEVVLS